MINPRTFEKVVASIFKDHGYLARVTAYSGDGGIDVILEGKDGDLIGVQVKRYKNKISVAQIRELTGALVLNGITKGIFVTTSEFQSGVYSIAKQSTERGYPIELIDATSFLQELKIAQLSNIYGNTRYEAVGRCSKMDSLESLTNEKGLHALCRILSELSFKK